MDGSLLNVMTQSPSSHDSCRAKAVVQGWGSNSCSPLICFYVQSNYVGTGIADGIGQPFAIRVKNESRATAIAESPECPASAMTPAH